MIRKLLRPPRTPRRRLVAGLVLLVVLSAGVGSWLLLRDDSPAAAAPTTATVATQTLQQTVSASGTVAAARTDELGFDASGTVTHVYVEPGAKVRKGQRLAAIDDDVLQAELSAARSALSAARTARSEHVSDGASDVQLAADDAAVLAAESSLAQAEDAAADAVLRATAKGTVTAVGLAVGDTVGGSASPSGGGSSDSGTGGSGSDTATITVVSSGRFVVEATVASGDVGKLKKGLQATLTVSGIDEPVYGTVSEVGLVAEADANGAAAFPVTIEVTDQRDDLFGGTSADISIVVSSRADVLTVDSRAVRTDGDQTYVEKVTDPATGATTRTDVELGETSGLVTEVVSGLQAGDVVSVPSFSGPGGGGGGGNLDQAPQRMRDLQQGGVVIPGGGVPPAGFGGGQ
ncbi:efflux RND transporter periplasmic adaptor subunit [Pimelobacter simplex]|uniref:efflux RND transporter periplasmic adaptor subunit n=1 Tax=Nocardioides simplex TaxID=2045 RepID=UPI003AAB366D